jgi:hypothetical protein
VPRHGCIAIVGVLPAPIRADLQARRERFALSYLVVGEDGQPALTEVISGL